MSLRAQITQAFGLVLRDARSQMALSQEALALQAGLDRTYISLLERGLRSPNLCVIVQLATVLRTPAGVLVTSTLERLA